MTTNLRIVIADDHQIVADGLVARLRHEPDLEICAAVNDGKAAVQACLQFQPDILLLDIHMPLMNGIEVATTLKQAQPTLKIITLTGVEDAILILRMMQAGVSACISKGQRVDLAQLIRLVGAGQALMPVFVLEALLQNLYLPARREETQAMIHFTEQEKVILRELMAGYTNKEIAAHLGLSTSTIKVHLSAIFRKLNVQTRTEAVAFVKIHDLLNQ